MMCNKCGCENITTAFICAYCGNDCQPIRTTSGLTSDYSSIDIFNNYQKIQAKRTVIGKVTPLYQGAP